MIARAPSRTAAHRSIFSAASRSGVLSMLFALGCSAPPGSEDVDGPPEFSGGLPNTGAPTPGAVQPGAVPPGGAASPAPQGAGGSGNEAVGAGVGLQPAPGQNQNQNAGQNQNQGTGGSAMVPPTNAGSGGSSMAAGGAGMAPVAPPPGNVPPGNQPPQNPPPSNPPPPAQPPPAVPLPGGFILIDDFEGGRDPQWTESEVGGGAGAFTIDTAVAASGSSSIRIDSNNAFHTMLQFALPQTVRDQNEVFGRVFLRLAATPNGAHFIWVEAGTATNDGHEMRLGHNVGQLQSNHFLNGEQDIRDQSRALVANVWYCLEFQMANDPDELRVWLDGEETLLSTTNYTAGPGAQGNTNPLVDFIPPLEAFRIGWELQNGTVWFDDVALANGRIGCD